MSESSIKDIKNNLDQNKENIYDISNTDKYLTSTSKKVINNKEYIEQGVYIPLKYVVDSNNELDLKFYNSYLNECLHKSIYTMNLFSMSNKTMLSVFSLKDIQGILAPLSVFSSIIFYKKLTEKNFSKVKSLIMSFSLMISMSALYTYLENIKLRNIFKYLIESGYLNDNEEVEKYKLFKKNKDLGFKL